MRVSNIARLPPAVRELLDEQLRKNGYGNFSAIAEDFRRRGWKVSKSALHRYSKKLEQRVASAMHEAEVLTHLGDDAAYLIRWARRNPAEARHLVARLKAKEQQQEGAPSEG